MYIQVIHMCMWHAYNPHRPASPPMVELELSAREETGLDLDKEDQGAYAIIPAAMRFGHHYHTNTNSHADICLQK